MSHGISALKNKFWNVRDPSPLIFSPLLTACVSFRSYQLVSRDVAGKPSENKQFHGETPQILDNYFQICLTLTFRTVVGIIWV